jgi:hypothetical protein
MKVDGWLAKALWELLALKHLLLSFSIELNGNALGTGLFPVPLAESVEVADPPNSRT